MSSTDRLRRPISYLKRWPSPRSVIGLGCIFSAALASSFLLRYEFDFENVDWQTFHAYLPLFVLTKLFVFTTLRVTRVWHAYVSFPELVRLAKATAISAGALTVILFLFRQLPPLPRSILIFDTVISAFYVGSLLSLYRLYRETVDGSQSSEDAQPVLIVGVNETGLAILRAIRSNKTSAYNPVGLISDDPKLHGRDIGGVRVVGSTHDVTSRALELGATAVLLISGGLTGKEVRELVEECNSHHLAVRIIPSVQQILQGHVDFQPRDVAIEDLLGREPVTLDLEGMSQWLNGRRILVTGSCGSIGSEIARQLLSFSPSALLLIDRSETGQFYLEHEIRSLDTQQCASVALADMTDFARMDAIFTRFQPEIVFHAAAYKHVPLMEHHPGEAIKNIIGATKNIVDLCLKHEVDSLVMISTDKAVNPTSVMGCCKRVAELYVQAAARQFTRRFVTVRFGNVLGSAGSVIPFFRQQIAKGGPVTVTHPDMTRFFMTIPEASQLVIQAGALGKGGEIFVLDMGSAVRILDLAEDLIRLSGLRPGVDIDIQISGLRPGEKLYEELYTDDEQQQPTRHPKILTAESERMVYMTVLRHIRDLLDLAESSPEDIRASLAQVVPRYRGVTRKAQAA